MSKGVRSMSREEIRARGHAPGPALALIGELLVGSARITGRVVVLAAVRVEDTLDTLLLHRIVDIIKFLFLCFIATNVYYTEVKLQLITLKSLQI